MKLHPDNRARGHTIVEVLIAASIFSVCLLVLAALFTQTQNLWRSINSRDVSRRELAKASASLQRDLKLASGQELSKTRVPPSLGSGDDGEAIWFLSPVDPVSGQMVHRQDAKPFWQRNILYYLVVPANHNNSFQVNCLGTAGPGGYEVACAHKVLIRKVIDSGPATIPGNETTQETLVPSVAAYLTRPNGLSVAAMAGEPNLKEVKIVATNLLYFATTAPGATQLDIELRAVAVELARHQMPLGSTSIYDSRYTRQAALNLILNN